MSVQRLGALRLGVAILLGVLAAAYLTRGYYELLVPTSATQAKDLHTNWSEEHAVYRHHTPYDLLSPYPPFTFLANAALFWMPWRFAPAAWGLVNLLCLTGLAVWAARHVYPNQREWAMVAGLAVPAFSAVSTGIGLGQNTIFYTSMLVAALLLCEQGLDFCGGLLLGVACSKISIALPFVFPFVVKFRWKTLAGTALYLGVATAALVVWVHQPAVSMFKQWMADAQRFAGIGFGFISILAASGMAVRTATAISAGGVLSVAAVVIALLRKEQVLLLFGIATTAGRLWTYHRTYDNFMLMILLVALFRAWASSSRPLIGWTALLLGLFLWAPPGASNHLAFEAMLFAVMLVATVVLGTLGRDLKVVTGGDAGKAVPRENQASA